jgi:hypothetical protein
VAICTSILSYTLRMNTALTFSITSAPVNACGLVELKVVSCLEFQGCPLNSSTRSTVIPHTAYRLTGIAPRSLRHVSCAFIKNAHSDQLVSHTFLERGHSKQEGTHPHFWHLVCGKALYSHSLFVSHKQYGCNIFPLIQ